MASERADVVNNFSMIVGTVNGSGSATSNTALFRAIFSMGIPVSGKNLFPSNIQGLPTWYTLRLSKDGYMARCARNQIVVAMNPDSFAQDVKDVEPGGVLFYDDGIQMEIGRDDIIIYPMAVKQLVKAADVPSNLRDYAANMVYVGVLAQLLGIDMKEIRRAIDFHFKSKQKPVESNMAIIHSAADWAAANLPKKDPFRVERMDKTAGYIMCEGNTACALGSIYGGVQFVGWYPITPASSLAEDINYYLPLLRKDPLTGKNTFAVIQAEDELAAIGMVIGAGWAGLRAMTSTSGPGISLMAEYIGFAYYAEIPAVVFNVQRIGPSTGLPTRTSQGDLTFVYFLSHGDTDHIILMPSTPTECFEMGWKAFDYADRFQTPVFVMLDQDLGMNQWMTKPFEYPNQPMDRGKVLWEEDLEKLAGQWGRYLDVDGDAIPYRTVAGNRHPASSYMTRGTGHNEYGKYTESPAMWEKMNNRIKSKFNTARRALPGPVIEKTDGAKIGLICWGSTDAAVLEARDQLRDRQGIRADFIRIRSLPINDEVIEFVRSHERVYVIELNRDGQLRQILTLELPDQATKMVSLCHVDGLPMTTDWVRQAVLAKEAK